MCFTKLGQLCLSATYIFLQQYRYTRTYESVTGENSGVLSDSRSSLLVGSKGWSSTIYCTLLCEHRLPKVKRVLLTLLPRNISKYIELSRSHFFPARLRLEDNCNGISCQHCTLLLTSLVCVFFGYLERFKATSLPHCHHGIRPFSFPGSTSTQHQQAHIFALQPHFPSAQDTESAHFNCSQSTQMDVPVRRML